MLSGPNAFDAFSCLVAAFSSEDVNGLVEMLSVSDMGTLGRVTFSGTLAFFPRGFSKCEEQVSNRFLTDLLLVFTDDI